MPDGVCNPVRHVFYSGRGLEPRFYAGRGLQPRFYAGRGLQPRL
jgi:hypothetical protein